MTCSYIWHTVPAIRGVNIAKCMRHLPHVSQRVNKIYSDSINQIEHATFTFVDLGVHKESRFLLPRQCYLCSVKAVKSRPVQVIKDVI
jgi:hypothetical protein